MILFSRVISGAALLAWIDLLLFRGRFWRLRDESARRAPGAARRIAAVVPARNEAALIASAVTSLLAQDIDGELRVYVVDDDSDDGTSERAAEAAERSGAGDRLNVVRAAALPPGWTGKVWALSQGIEAAREFAPDYILLTDADIEHGAGNVSSLVARADAESLDLASYMVKLHCDSSAEKALVPAFVFFFFKLYPPRWISDPRKRVAGAAGGCILIRPAVLDRIGGIKRIRGEIIDDCALAKQVKSSGGRIWTGLTSAARSRREYRDFVDIGNTIARTAFTQLKHSAAILVATIMGMMVLYIAPVAAVFIPDSAVAALGAAAWAGMTVAYAPAVRFYARPYFWSITLPLAALFYTGATIYSAIQYWTGQGGCWKGRVQDRKSNRSAGDSVP